MDKKQNKSKRITKKPVISLWKGVFFSLMLIFFSFIEFYFNSYSTLFWIFLSVGALIVLPTTLFSISKKFIPFGLPYLISMFKTKQTINFLKKSAKYGKIWELISTFGVFIGFGLAGIDFKLKEKKLPVSHRIIVLIISTTILGIVFHFALGWLFIIPMTKPLYLFSLIAFVLLGLGGFSLALLIGYGVLSIFSIFSGQQLCPMVAPVIPGVPIPGFGVVVPFIAWISLVIILVIHEFSHGILLTYYRQKINSVGLLLAGVFPIGAFVEQDDKHFSTLNEKKQLLVLSAGPTFNLITIPIAFLLIILFSFLVAPAVSFLNSENELMYDGMIISKVNEKVAFCGIEKDAPAIGVLEEGDRLLFIEGVSVDDSPKKAFNSLRGEGDKNITFLRDENQLSVIIKPAFFEDLNYSMIGIETKVQNTDYVPKWSFYPALYLVEGTNSVLVFLLLLSFAVGMFNFLPSDPLDGGKMGKIILEPYFKPLGLSKKETQKLIGRIFVWLFVISLILNIIPYITMLY